MKNIKISGLGLLLFITILSSCKKFVEVDGPKTSVSSKNIFDNDATAIGTITSLYVNMSRSAIDGPGELSSLSCIAGLSADELNCYNTDYVTLAAFYHNALTSSNSGYPGYWGVAYQRLYVVNSALENLSSSANLTPSVQQQLIGEAKFMRAFYYFYLVNLYGDAPLVLGSDYKVNALIAKSPKAQIYDQIKEDLKEAKKLLSIQYLKSDGTTAYPVGAEERVRPTKWAAHALLARVYLYNRQWAEAETESSAVLDDKLQYGLESLDRAFLKNNKEAIWQLQPVTVGENTRDARVFVLPEAGPNASTPVYLNEELIKDFEAGDHRKSSWTGNVSASGTIYYYPFKYKVIPGSDPNVNVTEYCTVMRLAEQFLIRSEARAEQGKLGEAIADIDQIRIRAGLKAIKDFNSTINKEELLKEIQLQRKLELFTEWGHRWLDLKRTGAIDKVMMAVTPKKSPGGVWKSYQQYYPIFIDFLKLSPNLIQTPGY